MTASKKSSAARRSTVQSATKLPPIKKSSGVPSASRHRCPHKNPSAPTKHNGPCALSEYHNSYKKHPLEPTQSFKPHQEPHRGDGPMQEDTTHRVDYVPHPLEKPFVHQGDQYVAPEGNIDSLTTHKRDYTPKAADRAKPIKKDTTRRTPGKFEGDPTYTSDYRKWALPRTEKISHDPGYKPPSAKFQGDPTYMTDYIKHPYSLRNSMKPAENARVSDQPFDGTTGYRDQFIKHKLPPKELRERPTYKPNNASLDGLTNYKKEYTPKDMQKQGSCKPDPKPIDSSAPFDSDTTHKVDYQNWPTERPFQHKPDEYHQPEGNFDHHTTTHTDFTRKPIDRVQMRKPDGSRRTPGKFDPTTNYGVDFRKWSAGERPKMTMKSEYSPPDAPFKGSTNYHDEYIKHNQLPPNSKKPADRGYQSNAPFEAGTEYRHEYIKKNVPDCPVVVIQNTGPSQAGYAFREQDPYGHKWYEPVSTSVMELPSQPRADSASLNKQMTALSVC